MKAAAALGLRLAISTREQRGRSALVVLAAALSSTVLLAVLATTRAEIEGALAWQQSADLNRLVAAITLATVLPVVALAGTVGRLSAIVRDQRLAALRLLGMTSAETRLVAACETAVAGLLGALVGIPLFLAIRPMLAQLELGGSQRPIEALEPGLLGWSLAVAGVPLAIVAVAALPRRGGIGAAMDTARRRDLGRPTAWRGLPLVVGMSGCAVLLITSDRIADYADASKFLGAVALTGVGLLLVLPVLVRIIGDIALRLARGPVGLLVARRLQAHPAGVSRMVAALMVGLFLVVGARAVIGAFEATDSYQAGVEARENGQQLQVRAAPSDVSGVRAEAADVDARVEWVVPNVTVKVTDAGTPLDLGALVATCADLRRIDPVVRGCVDGQVMSILDSRGATKDRIPVRAQREWKGVGETVMVPAPTAELRGGRQLASMSAQMVIPPSTPGITELASRTDQLVGVRGRPGDDLVASGAFGNSVASAHESSEYELVLGLRRILWTVGAVVIGLGLAGYAVATVDRAINRRRELTSLQLAGVELSTLRRAQFWEALLPSALGGTLAILCGITAGATYLALVGDLPFYPWRPIGGVVMVTVAGALLVALLIAATTSGRIGRDDLRQD